MNRDIETQDYILKQASESNVKFIRRNIILVILKS